MLFLTSRRLAHVQVSWCRSCGASSRAARSAALPAGAFRRLSEVTPRALAPCRASAGRPHSPVRRPPHSLHRGPIAPGAAGRSWLSEVMPRVALPPSLAASGPAPLFTPPPPPPPSEDNALLTVVRCLPGGRAL